MNGPASQKKVFLIGFLVIFLCLPTSLFAGAWTQKKGQLYSETLFTYFSTYHAFDEKGGRNHLPYGGHFYKEEWNEYVEYGITDKLTLVGNFFYDLIHYKDQFHSDRNYGFTNNELALRYRITKEPVVLSFQQMVSIPSRFEERPSLPLANAQVDIEPRILLGKSFQKIKTYVNCEAGIRFRLEEPAHEFRHRAVIGFKGFLPLEIAAEYDGVMAIGNGKSVSTGNNVTRTLEADYYRLTGTALLHIKSWLAIKTQAFVHVAGSNTGAGWGITTGIVLTPPPLVKEKETTLSREAGIETR